jgi:putative membrane protein
MIRYEPHPAWLRDILHLPISYALRRALYGALAMGAYAWVVCLAFEHTGSLRLPHSGSTVGIAGAVVSFGIAFRLNNAYARWWEGRTHWGALVNHARNLAVLANVFWSRADVVGRLRMAGLLGDFCVGLALHLRGELHAADLESVESDEREIADGRRHPLSYLSELVWREIDTRRADGTIDCAQVLALRPHAEALLDITGACERIRNTPIPFAVTVVTRLFLLSFLLLVPVGLHEDFGNVMVPLSMVAFFGLAAMDVLAAELENPFGIDCNDLPTRTIAETIRRNVHEILGVERVGAPDVEPLAPPLYSKIH